LGLHRYDVAQGFKPEVLSLSGTTVGDVLAQASDLFVGSGASVVVGGERGLEGAACCVGAVGSMMGIDRVAVRAWLEASCLAQGVPVGVTNPAAVALVGVLMRGGVQLDGREAPDKARRPSQLPAGDDAGRVDRSST
jgi:hypothetical protein